MKSLLPLLALLAASCASVPPAAEPAPEIAITMDDLPEHGPLLTPEETRVAVARRILAAFRDAGVPQVYGFVNGTRLEQDPGLERVLEAWRDAGYPLGNHTWSHASLDAVTAEQYEAELARNEPLLARLGGRTDWHWFRYPFLAEGQDPAKRAAVRQALARRGYRIAQVSMSYGDYEFSEAYARCVAKGDGAGVAEVERSYMEAVESAVNRSRAVARAAFGHDIPYVLLTHISAMNARMMPRVLAFYRRAGFRFVTLERAESDPAYAADVDPSRPPQDLQSRLGGGVVAIPRRYDPAPLLERVCR
ncbi:MAG TPA: polysaccharide deacetylase family protein [Allosphingosinicella sp.]|jgi:peptidoglycan/xylan/chitin deacetylase (PgdA/CDA1 family)